MPNRIVREAILSSESVAVLSWAEEVFYRRLMSIVDDYGRFEANLQLVRAKCYPLQIDDVKASDVAAWMESCRLAGILTLYSVNGKNYLEISKFQQQTRTPSKFPSPDSECSQMISFAHLGVVVSVVEDVSVSGAAKATVQQAAQVRIPLEDYFDEFWSAYPLKKGKEAARKAWAKIRPSKELKDRIMAAVSIQARQDRQWLEGYVPHAATYLNGKRWEDEITKGKQPQMNLDPPPLPVMRA